jgi:putrescine transport system ATP-binding protein
MNRGRLEQVAPPAEVYEQPASRWVADFIGDINLFEGKVAASTPTDTVVETEIGDRLRVAQPVEVEPGTTVWLALRPEKIALAAVPSAVEGENSLPGRISDIGYLGDMSVYKVRLDNGHIVKVTAANRRRLIERPFGFDQQIWLSWPAEAGVVLTR